MNRVYYFGSLPAFEAITLLEKNLDRFEVQSLIGTARYRALINAENGNTVGIQIRDGATF